ncbi:MAG TPA: recombination-associated protein RdgC [Polyangiaceae bacterium]|nr:recombination-associated protein RdgC [Polyangiaceae bacterium]
MGALKGSITYSRFYVQGELPENFANGYMRRIRNRMFEPLTPDSDDPTHWGWCSIADPFDLELDQEKVFFNAYLNLGLRIDRWSVPAPLVKAQLAQATKAVLEKKGRERLSRAEKEELKSVVVRKLRKQLLPAMKVIDLSWNTETGVVRFWSRSKKSVEMLHEMFEKTFGLKLLPHGPYAAAVRAGCDPEQLERLSSTQPAVFHAETATAEEE